MGDVAASAELVGTSEGPSTVPPLVAPEAGGSPRVHMGAGEELQAANVVEFQPKPSAAPPSVAEGAMATPSQARSEQGKGAGTRSHCSGKPGGGRGKGGAGSSRARS